MSLLHDPAFTAAPVPTCAGACPAPHQVCQCEGRACPPIPRPHPGPGAEQRLRQGSTVDLALASKGARGRLPSPREACGLALVWGREVTVTVGLLEPLLCAVICKPLLHRPVCSSLSETHHGSCISQVWTQRSHLYCRSQELRTDSRCHANPRSMGAVAVGREDGSGG